MISINKLLDIICTEAIEYGGVQEVPDRADGTTEHYHSLKRPARSDFGNINHKNSECSQVIDYTLELIEMDGELKWVK